ncbi:hypothetical protein CPB83DRAFT_900728 [Crepidotus variabilis]|uniref:Uncharacterized protein n=1 Tax=Crepidotus variabilis TaxID=179855 RepID=A0A9P6E2J5_9AGAR|nr:hypothetical protein CPB83DRAFT_900728 [Crepidotus variabilis]
MANSNAFDKRRPSLLCLRRLGDGFVERARPLGCEIWWIVQQLAWSVCSVAESDDSVMRSLSVRFFRYVVPSALSLDKLVLQLLFNLFLSLTLLSSSSTLLYIIYRFRLTRKRTPGLIHVPISNSSTQTSSTSASATGFYIIKAKWDVKPPSSVSFNTLRLIAHLRSSP